MLSLCMNEEKEDELMRSLMVWIYIYINFAA